MGTWRHNLELRSLCFSAQANLNEQQIASNTLVRALMTAVCHSAIICKERGRGKWRERGFDLGLLGLSQVKSAVLHLSLSFSL